MVVSIAQAAKIDSSFSADTDMAEVLIIARSLRTGEKAKRLAYFVNLSERPADKLAAQETAKAIKKTIASLPRPGTHSDAVVGDIAVATVRLERVKSTEKWTTVRVANVGLVQVAGEMAEGKLRLPRRRNPVPIPITRLGNMGRVGPVHRDIDGGSKEPDRGPFSKHKGADSGTEWPFLWNHNSKRQQSMAVAPDSHGIVKPGKEDEAEAIWQRASRLHINCDFQFNANPTCAVYTEQKSAGGRAWPNFRIQAPEMEKAACVWLNGTLGIIAYWINSNRSQSGRGGTTVTAIPNIPALDVARLDAERLQAAVQIYDDLCLEPMLPANEAWRDLVRQELDRRLLTEVLGLDDEAVDQLAILRNQWCREPTVTGTKRTGPDG